MTPAQCSRCLSLAKELKVANRVIDVLGRLLANESRRRKALELKLSKSK